jgi:nitrate reductase cytochrome c-type subunit
MWETKLNRTFSKEEIQMDKNTQKMLTISGHKGNENLNHTKIPPLTPVRIAIIKNTTNNKCWQGCRGKRTSHTAGGNRS